MVKIGYLMNCYPMISTTFIRREIETLVSMNVEINRYAIRYWDHELVDPLDIAELSRTHYLLSGRKRRLIANFLLELLINMPGLIKAIGPWVVLFRNSKGYGSVIRHFAYFLEAISLRQETKRDGISHLHVHFSTNSTAVAMLSKFMGGPSYSFTVHGPDEFIDPTSSSLHLKIKHSAFVVAVSHFCKAQIIRFSSMDFWEKIHIIRCGVNLEEFALNTDHSANNKTLVCVGRLCLQKGQLLLPMVVASLREEFPDLRVVLIGDGEIRHLLEAQISKFRVSDMIELMGWQSSTVVQQAIRNSRALLLPSFAEGLPIVIMEALALGRPVISTYIAGIPELLDSGCAWIVPSGSEANLIEAMREVLAADPEKLHLLGLEGRRRIENCHDVQKNTQQLYKLLHGNFA